MIGQQKIKGRLDSKTQQFITSNEEYHIDFFQEDITRIYRAGYIGLINKKGEILVQPKYDQIFDFQGGLAKISIHKKNGLINKSGEVILEPFFGEIEDFENGFAKCKIDYYDSRIINSNGEFINEHTYAFIGAQYQNHFPFIREDKMGLLTTGGEEIVVISDYNDQEYSRLVNYFHLGASIVLDGKEISPLFKFEDDRALTFAKVGEDLKFGCIDPNGKVVIPIEFDQIEPFKDGVAAARKGKLWGVIDAFGKTIIPFEHLSLTVANKERFIISETGSFGIIDTDNSKITPIQYESISANPDGRFVVSKNGKFGLLNEDGSVQLKLEHPALLYLFDGLHITHNTKKWGVINSSGKTVLSFDYDGIRKVNVSTGIASKYKSSYSLNTGIPRFSYTGNYFTFNSNGLTSKKGNTFSTVVEMRGDFYNKNSVIGYGPSALTPHVIGNVLNAKFLELDSMQVYSSLPGDFTIVRKEIESTNGDDNVIPIGLSQVVNQYTYGVINEKNEFLIPLQYDELVTGIAGVYAQHGIISKAPQNLLVARKGELYGVINLKNEIVVPFEYQNINLLPAMISVMKVKTEKVEDTWGDVYYEEEYSAGILDFKGEVIVQTSEVSYGNELLEEWFNDDSRKAYDY